VRRLGKYFFTPSEYQIARLEYEKSWGMKPSRFDKILVSLSSEFGSREEVKEAETVIEERINKLVEAYQSRNLEESRKEGGEIGDSFW